MLSINSLLDHDGIPKLFFISVLTIFLLVVIWKFGKIIISDISTKILFLIIFLFLAWTAVSINSAINITEGVTNWVSLVIVFLFLIAIIYSGFFKAEIIFRLVPITVFLLTTVLFYQIIVNLIENGKLQIDHTLCSTLSNKNFLSESLVLLLPFALAGGITDFSKKRKMNVVASCLILFNLIILQTLSAWLCILFLVLIFGPVYWFMFSGKNGMQSNLPLQKIVLAIAGITLICFLLITWLNKNNSFEPLQKKVAAVENYLKTDFSDLIKNDSTSNINSVFERLFLWRNTTLLAKENAMTGIGFSNWRILWPKYGVGGAYFLSSGIMHYEHPHNEFLLYFSELGIIGLILFLLIFGMTIFISVATFKKSQDIKEKKIIFILSYGVFIFLILSFFGYPFHRPFSVALLMVTISKLVGTGINEVKLIRKNSVTHVALMGGLIFCLFSLKVFSARWNGEYYMRAAFNEQAHGRFQKMYQFVNKADNDYFKIDLLGTPLDWYRGFALNYMGSDSSLYYFRRAESQNPYHIQILSDIGAKLENKGEHEEAIKYFNRAIAIIPGYKEAHFNLAIAYYKLGKPKEALTEINKAYMVGEPYLRALETVLILNVDSMIQQSNDFAKKICFNKYANNKTALKKINEAAMKKNISFETLLNDSCK
jgi:O-antigen ligase